MSISNINPKTNITNTNSLSTLATPRLSRRSSAKSIIPGRFEDCSTIANKVIQKMGNENKNLNKLGSRAANLIKEYTQKTSDIPLVAKIIQNYVLEHMIDNKNATNPKKFSTKLKDELLLNEKPSKTGGGVVISKLHKEIAKDRIEKNADIKEQYSFLSATLNDLMKIEGKITDENEVYAILDAFHQEVAITLWMLKKNERTSNTAQNKLGSFLTEKLDRINKIFVKNPLSTLELNDAPEIAKQLLSIKSVIDPKTSSSDLGLLHSIQMTLNDELKSTERRF